MRRGILRWGIYSVATILLFFATLLLFRNPLLSEVLSRLLERQSLGLFAIEVTSSTSSSITIGLDGKIVRETFSADVHLPQVNVSFSLGSIVAGKVEQVSLVEGKIDLLSHPVNLDSAEAPSKENNMAALVAALFTEVPFKRLEFQQMRISLEDEGRRRTEIEKLSGWIAANNFSLSVKDGDTANTFAIQGTRNLKSQDLEFHGNLSESSFLMVTAMVLPSKVKLSTGQLHFSGKISKREQISKSATELSGVDYLSSLNVSAERLSGSVQGFQIEGGKLQAFFPNLQKMSMEDYGTISLESIKNVIELRDVQGKFALRFDRSHRMIVEIDDVSGHVVGGIAKVSHGEFPMDDLPWGVEVALQGIDLEQLLALYPQSKFAVTGTLDGQIPIGRNREGFTVKEGHIASTTPGKIMVRDTRLPEDKDKVLLLLRDFSYDTLQGDVSYLPSGDLTVALHLSGKNPEWQKGQLVNLNVTISENLLAFMQSVRHTVGIGDRAK